MSHSGYSRARRNAASCWSPVCLLLVVVTIIALSMFRSFGIQEKIAGNMREKQRRTASRGVRAAVCGDSG